MLAIPMVSEEDYLLRTAKATEGMSGRALRKLPLKAHAFHLEVKREKEGGREEDEGRGEEGRKGERGDIERVNV